MYYFNMVELYKWPVEGSSAPSLPQISSEEEEFGANVTVASLQLRAHRGGRKAADHNSAEKPDEIPGIR